MLNDLKNRGVQDILILCADGLSGIKGAIAAAFPNTEYQRSNVHHVRNTLRYVAEKDKKPQHFLKIFLFSNYINLDTSIQST